MLTLAQAAEIANAIERSTQGRSDTAWLAFALIILLVAVLFGIAYVIVRLGPQIAREVRAHLQADRESREQTSDKFAELQRETNGVVRENTRVMYAVEGHLTRHSEIHSP